MVFLSLRFGRLLILVTSDARGIYKVDNWNEAIRKAEGMGADRIEQDGKALREYIIERYNIAKVNEKRLERIVG